MITHYAALALAAAISRSTPTKASQLIAELYVSESLYYAAERASGVKLCDKELRALQERRFDAEYGERVTRLIPLMTAAEAHESKPGDDKNSVRFVVVSYCIRLPKGKL